MAHQLGKLAATFGERERNLKDTLAANDALIKSKCDELAADTAAAVSGLFGRDDELAAAARGLAQNQDLMQGIVSKVCENISSKIAPGFEGYKARLESLEALMKLMRDDAAKAAAHGINPPGLPFATGVSGAGIPAATALSSPAPVAIARAEDTVLGQESKPADVPKVPSDQAALGSSLVFRSACASAPHQQGLSKGEPEVIDWDAIRRGLSPIQWQAPVPGAAAAWISHPVH